MSKIDFEVSITVDNRTGETLATYFRVRKGRSAETRELTEGVAFADYNSKGELLGVELLAPCNLTLIERIVKSEPAPVKRFVKGNMPRQMIVT